MPYTLTPTDRTAMEALMRAHVARYGHRLHKSVFAAHPWNFDKESLYYVVFDNNEVYRVDWDAPTHRLDDAALHTGALRQENVPPEVAAQLGWTGDDE